MSFPQRNRRKIPRYGIGSLRVWLHRPGFLGMFAGLMEVTPCDFSRMGLAFRHQRMLSPGQPVVLDLLKDGYRLTNIVTVVRCTTQMATHFRCGVEFDFEANDHLCRDDLEQTLRIIEGLLKDVVIIA